MDKPRVTPKDFFLWAGAMIALYVATSSFVTLFFNYINYAFPDALNPIYVQPYSSGIRFEIASLIVLTPVYFLLMYFIRRDIGKHPAKRNIWVRRWALVLTLFLAAALIVGDLITLINYFLGGELTERFVLKVAIILLVAAIFVMHFLADMWGYWNQYPSRGRSVGIAVAIAVIATVAAGFFIMGTPGEVRLYSFDEQKVSDLQNIQSQIVSYWQEEGTLPATLSDLNDSVGSFNVPTDPQTGAQYGYEATATSSFQVCANFNAVTQPYSSSPQYVSPTPAGAGQTIDDDWFHGAGQTCFDRTIDPARYPVMNQQNQ